MTNLFLTDDEIKVVEEVREFVKSIPPALIRMMDANQIDYPKEFIRSAASRRLLGLRFPSKFGGRGQNWMVEVSAIEEVGVLGTSLACLYSLPSIVGEGIAVFGTEYQKERFLRPTLLGESFCAEALTEPRGGSDFFGATTRAYLKDGYWVIEGQKRFIVGAKGADYFFLYARTGEQPKDITAFLVERDESVKVEYLYNLMGTRGGGTGRVRFMGTKVPPENVILGVNRGPEVFDRMMLPERLTSAAGAIGLGRAAIEIAAKYSTRRKAFGRVIKSFEGVSFKVADAVSALDSARALVYACARSVDRGYDSRRLVSEAKKVATESAWLAVNNAMQILGGIGYTDIYPVERLMRDARLALIWTGTNEIMNLLIQHEYYKELMGGVRGRDIEKDAISAEDEMEKVYE